MALWAPDFIFLVVGGGTGSCYVVQNGLKLLISNAPPASTSQASTWDYRCETLCLDQFLWRNTHHISWIMKENQLWSHLHFFLILSFPSWVSVVSPLTSVFLPFLHSLIPVCLLSLCASQHSNLSQFLSHKICHGLPTVSQMHHFPWFPRHSKSPPSHLIGTPHVMPQHSNAASTPPQFSLIISSPSIQTLKPETCH
jgi:hypothetical protein